jgi:hypothetical protein
VSRFYGPADADALVPGLVTVVTRLRDQRSDLVGIRDAVHRLEGDLGGTSSPDAAPADPVTADRDAPELRRLRLRMRGIVDQMQADVAWLDDRDIVLRDIATGLLDFPALAGGRPVWLCWHLGEDRVGFWHGTEEGFADRKPLAALPGAAALA